MLSGKTIIIPDGSINNTAVVIMFVIFIVINFVSYILQMSNSKDCLIELKKLKEEVLSKNNFYGRK